MNRRERLRRTGKLCLHCLMNLAFFRASHDARAQWEGQQFWVTLNNNYLDIAVLEWCKVFGDRNAKHAWRKVVTEQGQFFPRLLDHLRLTEELFNRYILEMRTYRDKFVAHLDEENRMDIPNMAHAIKSAQFLYQWLLDHEDDCNAFPVVPRDSVAYFQEYMTQGRTIYAEQPGIRRP